MASRSQPNRPAKQPKRQPRNPPKPPATKISGEGEPTRSLAAVSVSVIPSRRSMEPSPILRSCSRQSNSQTSPLYQDSSLGFLLLINRTDLADVQFILSLTAIDGPIRLNGL